MSTKKEDTGSSDSVIHAKQDTVAPVDAPTDEAQPEYATGYRLFAIMGTILLSTLLAALDLVSTTCTFC